MAVIKNIYGLYIYNQANDYWLGDIALAYDKQPGASNYGLISGEVVEEINGEQSLTFQADYRTDYVAVLVVGNCVRLQDRVADTYVLYRIKRVSRFRSGQKVIIECFCEHIKYDLLSRVIPTAKRFVQVTPATVLAYILTFSDAFVSGTVTPTTAIDFDIDYESCMEAIKRLAEKTGYEWDVIADGGANHKKVNIRNLDFIANGTGGACEVAYGVNLLSLKHTLSLDDGFASRIVPRGGAAMAGQRKNSVDISSYMNPVAMDVVGAMFIITANTGRWIKLDTDQLLTQNDSLNGWYLYFEGYTLLITDSLKTVGDYDQLQTLITFPDNSLADMKAIIFQSLTVPSPYVPDAKAETDYLRMEKVFRNEDIADVLNAAGPAGISDLSGVYTDGLCEGWELIDTPTVSETVDPDFVRIGTKSQKVIATDGQGIKRPVYTGSSASVSYYVWIYIESIDPSAKLVTKIKVGATEYFPTNKTTGEDEAVYNGTGWRQIIVEGGVCAEGTTSHDLEILADGGACTFYVDAVCVVMSEYINDEDKFFAYDSRADLWKLAQTELLKCNAPKVTYDVSMVDLWQRDRTTYITKLFKTGDDITIVDAALGINATVRVTKKSWQLTKPWECRIDVE